MLAVVVLTIIVNGERDVGCDDVIEADLAVLRWAVGINGFHPYNTIKQTTLGHRCLIPTLHKDRRELVHIVYTNVHGGPGKRGLRDIRATGSGIHYYRNQISIWIEEIYYLWDFLLLVPSGPSPQSYAWMVKLCSFWLSQSRGSLDRTRPSPVERSNTTASNWAEPEPPGPLWTLNPQISPEKRKTHLWLTTFVQILI